MEASPASNQPGHFFSKGEGAAANPGTCADNRAAPRAWERGTDPTGNQGKLASALYGSEPPATPSDSMCLSADFPEPHPQATGPAQLWPPPQHWAGASLLWLSYQAKQQRKPADRHTPETVTKASFYHFKASFRGATFISVLFPKIIFVVNTFAHSVNICRGPSSHQALVC